MLELVSHSADETIELGKKLGALAAPGDFFALVGELGSGKTQFAKGVAVGAGATVAATSPTYTILNEYSGRFPLYHFDLYRLAGDDDVTELGLDWYFDGDGICIIEWAERLIHLLPEERLDLTFTYCGDDCRSILLKPVGERYVDMVGKLSAQRTFSSGPRQKNL